MTERTEVYFDGEDVPLLTQVISLIPGLHTVAVACKVSRSVPMSFPVERREELFMLLGPDEARQVGEQEYTKKDVERFFPSEFFPLTSERDFMEKLLIVLQRGEIYHTIRHTETAKARNQANVEHLPSPEVPTELAEFERYLENYDA